ncbi:MAG TPA: monovalent cation/H+ antiporter complex subunit F [Phycisphaerae bacterium]|nr:monovalent cation/H+ antiporter complex subunit F [Phycisphaerae bacterium]
MPEMNVWLWCAWVVLLALLPAGWMAFRGPVEERLAGLELASSVAIVALMMMAQGVARSSFFDIALALTLLSFGGGMVFARFVQRWL